MKIPEIANSLGLSEFWLGIIAGCLLSWIFFPRRRKNDSIVRVDPLSQINIASAQSASSFGSLQPQVSVSTSTTNLDDSTVAKIKEALQNGNKIEAIKILREVTNCDLVTAKSTVEGLEKVFNLIRL